MPVGTVLIVAGVGGNEIYAPGSFLGLGPAFRIWLEPAAMAAGFWRLLGLAPDGTTPQVPWTGPMVPGPPLGAYYSTLGNWLARRGWKVVGVDLDWRQTLARDGQRLADTIRAWRSAAPLCLVCHSRGGLVARAALPLLAATGDLALVGRCVGLGVPHQGSWYGCGMLSGWAETVRLLELVLAPAPAIWLPAGLLQTVTSVTTTWPSSYELMPRPGAPWLPESARTVIYNPSLWAQSGHPVSAAWLSYAASQWASLPLVPSEVEWVDAFGRGLPTPEGLHSPVPPRGTGDMEWIASGDGVVLAESAVQPGRLYISSPTSHGALVYDGRLFEVIDSYLQSGMTAGVTISGPTLM